MLLLLQLENFNTDKIDLKFDDGINDFEAFENIFSSLKLTDSLTAEFIAHLRSQDPDKILVKSEVLKLSKHSPFELSAFVTDKWFDVFLFILSSDKIIDWYKRKFLRKKENAKAITENLTSFIKHIPKDYDERRLKEVIDWFLDLPKTKQGKYLEKVKKGKSFEKIVSFKFKSGARKK